MSREHWPFYVYELLRGGERVYIGKGCRDRLKQSCAKRIVDEGREIARFRDEAAAYAFEKQLIAECRPELNRVGGGGGHKANWRPKRLRNTQDAWEKQFLRIGSRRYVAQILVGCWRHRPDLFDPAAIPRIWATAYGSANP